MSEEWTAEELRACLKVLKNNLIMNNGHFYVRDWEFQLLDAVMEYLNDLSTRTTD